MFFDSDESFSLPLRCLEADVNPIFPGRNELFLNGRVPPKLPLPAFKYLSQTSTFSIINPPSSTFSALGYTLLQRTSPVFIFPSFWNVAKASAPITAYRRGSRFRSCILLVMIFLRSLLYGLPPRFGSGAAFLRAGFTSLHEWKFKL